MNKNYDELIKMADEMRKVAYAPYSNYRVGAILLCKNGKIFKGCNIENASYPLGNCAERTAIFNAISAGEKDFECLVICAEKMPYPCGACRQVICEFAPELEIIVAENTKKYEKYYAKDLLPMNFKLK